jgi:nucleotide-binding universal stress UspA family protein
MDPDAKTNILLAVDLAPGEPTWLLDGAVDMAKDLVRDRADHVVVLHVREFSVSRLAAMMREHGGADGRHAVDEIVARLRAAGVTASGLIREADEGHVVHTILEAAGEFNARLIVLGSPRHRISIGSVANRLMRQADVPIVIAARTRARVDDEILVAARQRPSLTGV